MWIAEIAERSIMQAMDKLDVTFRASRVDNETDAETQRKVYPAMVIMASSGNRGTIESLFDEVPIIVQLITHHEDDPKRTTLARLEDEFRTILDKPIATSTVRTAFNAIALEAGKTRYFKGLTDIEGGMIEITDKQQTITINMTMHVCGS